ncbi:NADH-quinone oxidoreductase subunit A [Xanthocytophaga agilis]|uniref:NADH-quinone oxidoreductase subunit A n=1 Tax=Xanthocytophaga agilis TaxID=3048010 RepID=A0AAE3UJ84_9BACT|nr:NADH-quinone oxidoreductase subunit A [Xanthocytophaga agilis]MDJ1506461.1 NADH-quinone oxidoreductase subunit A [Xanthocytophaga agilis]
MSQISEFGTILLFIIGAIAFFLIAMFSARLLRPDRPNSEKLSTYESGEEPIGDAWGRFNVQFYIVALVFILFDVEIVFLFPWAVVFGDVNLNSATQGLWSWFTLIEMFIFVAILSLGLAYAWVKGYLDWVKPKPEPIDFESKVPASLYEQVNEKYAVRKDVNKTVQ